jgi:hypothetical protein
VRQDFADRLESCAVFEEGIPAGACQTDGHYICEECRWMDQARTRARVEADTAVSVDQEIEAILRDAQSHIDACRGCR